MARCRHWRAEVRSCRGVFLPIQSFNSDAPLKSSLAPQHKLPKSAHGRAEVAFHGSICSHHRMGGRKSDGRPLLSVSCTGRKQKPNFSKRNAASNALNAFALAADQALPPGRRERTAQMPSRGRGQKRQRTREAEGGDVADEDGDEDGNGAARPSKKRARNGDDGVGHRGDGDDFGGFSGSDSEGHEWHEGLNSEDDDSDIDSDAAFGDSDEERYEGYAFKGSSSKKGGEDSGLEDSESLGSDAIDLAQALDQFSENELEGEKGDSGSESSDDNTSSAESVESDDDDDDENDPVRLESLQALVAGFGGDDDAEGTAEATTGKKKLSLKDLSVFGVDDPKMKQSLKLMGKEEKAAKSGGSKRLDVPLARRQQDRFLRTAAYDKASETLNRWTETVKQNRRADHLVFPLAQNAQDAGLYNRELVPLTQERSGTELENTILAIMEESGLGPSPNSASDKRVDHAGEQEKAISRADYTELQRQRRREREQHSREQARAKRIKKIKSKTYRRIHRKERIREDEVTRQEMLEAGELDSEAEREAHDMRRAMERMG